MLVLGIETSCDETSAAVVKDGRQVTCCTIATSKQDFRNLSGVIPEDAARQQLISILPVIEQTLKDSGASLGSIDAIAVTMGPGFLGSLLTGTVTARALSAVFLKPLVGVHHTLGHLTSTWLWDDSSGPTTEPEFPILALSVSGGHSDLWYRTSHTSSRLLGSTRDDAAGEAFDKGASLLGLAYPGGPELEKLAQNGNPKKYKFPQPLKGGPTLDFSFSGLKTSLKYLLNELREQNPDEITHERASIAASFQQAICQHLTSQVLAAISRSSDIREVHIVGGVSANSYLRNMLHEKLTGSGIILRTPVNIRYCTDNGAMIAAAATFLMKEKPKSLNGLFKTGATSDLLSANEVSN
jgi:N6-L-threonylcarbamoyladenine synthase